MCCPRLVTFVHLHYDDLQIKKVVGTCNNKLIHEYGGQVRGDYSPTANVLFSSWGHAGCPGLDFFWYSAAGWSSRDTCRHWWKGCCHHLQPEPSTSPEVFWVMESLLSQSCTYVIIHSVKVMSKYLHKNVLNLSEKIHRSQSNVQQQMWWCQSDRNAALELQTVITHLFMLKSEEDMVTNETVCLSIIILKLTQKENYHCWCWTDLNENKTASA